METTGRRTASEQQQQLMEQTSNKGKDLRCSSFAKQANGLAGRITGIAVKPRKGSSRRVINLDSDESSDCSDPGSPVVSIHRLSSASQVALGARSGGGRYSGRLRGRGAAPKKYHPDFIPVDEIFSDDSFTGFLQDDTEHLRNAESLPNWGARKPRNGDSSQSRVFPVHDRTAAAPDVVTQWSYDKSSRDFELVGAKKGHTLRPLGLEQAVSSALNHELQDRGYRSRQQWHNLPGNSVPRAVRPRSRSVSIGRNSSSCKLNNSACTGNMVTHLESYPRDLGGRYECPAAPSESPVRKRKVGVLSDEQSEYQNLNGLANHRSWSDSSERPVQPQVYQLSSDGEEGANQHFRGMQGFFGGEVADQHSRGMQEFPGHGDAEHSRGIRGFVGAGIPLQSGIPIRNLRVDDNLNGEFANNPRLTILEQIVTGSFLRNPTGAEFYCCGSPGYNFDNPESLPCSNLQGDLFMKSGRNACGGTTGELSASESLGASQTDLAHTSDDDYHPPGQVQSHLDNADNPILIDRSSRTRRFASSHYAGEPERVSSLSDLVSNCQPASVAPGGVTRPRSNTSAVVRLDPNSDTGGISLTSRIAPPPNGAHHANLDVVRESDEANDPNLLDDDDEDELAHNLFDLNELPDQQPQKIPKARKKHRPKVFREGRPYRVRKPKKPEDEASKKKAEVQKVGEKPRGRKKRATAAAANPTQGNSLGQQSSHCERIASDPSGFGVCQTNGGMQSPVGQCVIAQEGSPSRVDYVNSEIENAQTPVSECRLERRAINTLVMTETFGNTNFLQARDCSPLSTSSSVSPNLSRKRTGELESLAISEGLLNQLGVRRELFKKARGGKAIVAVVEQSLGTGENLQEPMIPLDGPNFVQISSSVIAPAAPVKQKRKYTRKPQSNGPDNPPSQTRRRKQVAGADESHEQTTEAGSQEGSGITHDKSASISPGGRRRIGARSRPRYSPLSDSVHNRPVPRLFTEDDLDFFVSHLVSSFSRLGFDEGVRGLEIVPHVNQNKGLVVYDGPFHPLRRKKSRAKVMLDGEDKRVWRLLMAKGTDFEDENSEKDASKQWEEERAIMKTRAEKFINRMHLVQGDRRFSVWKGSVVDSIVGAFLTQNVSDHLSSSAFMALAARFPVPRKKKSTPEVFHEAVVTEFQEEEEALDISGKVSGFPVSMFEEGLDIIEKVSGFPVATVSNAAEDVHETVPAALHLEDAIHISEKSSTTGGRSSVSCNQHDHYAVPTKGTDCNLDWGQSIQSPEKRVQSMSEGQTTVESNDTVEKSLNWSPDDGREQNSSCSSKASRSECNSCLHNMSSRGPDGDSKCSYLDKPHLLGNHVPSLLVHSLEMMGSAQQEPGREVEVSTSVCIEPVEVLISSAVHSQANSNLPASSLDLDEHTLTKRTLPISKTCFEEDSRLLSSPTVEPFLVVDLCLSAEDILSETFTSPQQHSFGQAYLTHGSFPRTYVSGWNSVPQSKNHQSPPVCKFSVPTGSEENSAADEEVGVNTGSGIFSSNSCESLKASLTSLQPGSEVNCATSEEIEANQGRVIFSSDSFDTSKFSEKQLVHTTTEDSEDGGGELAGQLPLRRESSNLHNLKGIMRKKSNTLQKVVDPNSLEVNMDYSSQLTNSSSSNHQGKEVEGPKKLSFIGLSGLARARMEQAHTKSKVAVDWEAVRLKYNGVMAGGDKSETPHIGCKSFGSSNVENGVDWDAVRLANLEDIANVIKERGMNNVLAGRIKAFLERVQTEHGSVDLEWLRTVSVEEAKSFLLSVRGLGLKSVECIRLLTLHHLAFPVDTNVGRICVRLGWVPLEPLPEELQLHLLELYPVQETIQKYLWPRLCSLDQRTLYELHYQMITFGKVFCTKSRPNCNACPMRDDCQHFASALASARLALPAAPHDDAHSTSSEKLALPAAAAEFIEKAKLALPPLKDDDSLPGKEGQILSSLNSFTVPQTLCEPIIEEPTTPEHRVADVKEIDDIEQFGKDEEYDTFVGLSSQPQNSELDKGAGSEIEIVLPTAASTVDSSSKALVLLHPGIASIPVPKLKNVGRLRTVHYVYELPDDHPLLNEMDDREPDDPCFYLLAIWSPGEAPQAPPVLDDVQTNGTCDGFNSSNEETVKGTVLVPCRTAMRGIFPLNGTYFQVNEVFADHASSLQPIEVPRTLLWNLRRRFVYFGTSVTTIFKGLSTEEIQACFWRGYVCVRGFDGVTRCPRPLAARLHFPASKMLKKTKGEANTDFNA